MTDQWLGAATAGITIFAFVTLLGCEYVFLSLPQVKRLKDLRETLSNTLIDGRRLEYHEVGGKRVRAEPLKVLLFQQIDALALNRIGSDDRFRSVAESADIIALRVKLHKRLLRELKAMCAAICLVFVLGLAWTAPAHKFNSVDAVLSSSPAMAIGLELMTFLFLIYRLVQEYRDVRELNDGPAE